MIKIGGKQKELQILEKYYQKGSFQFGYIYGQRRIGKTTLLEMFTKTKKRLIFYAVDSDDNSILKDFAKSLAICS